MAKFFTLKEAQEDTFCPDCNHKMEYSHSEDGFDHICSEWFIWYVLYCPNCHQTVDVPVKG